MDYGVAISFSRGSSRTRDRTWLSCIAGGLFTTEPPGKPLGPITFISFIDLGVEGGGILVSY